MRYLFQIACFSFLVANCPSTAEENEECQSEFEELSAEKMNDVISKLDKLSKKIDQHVQNVEQLNEVEE